MAKAAKAPTLTENVVHAKGDAEKSDRRPRSRRGARLPVGASDPRAEHVLRSDLSPFVGGYVLITARIAGQYLHYHGVLARLLPANAHGKGAAAELSPGSSETPATGAVCTASYVVVALRWITNCVELHDQPDQPKQSLPPSASLLTARATEPPFSGPARTALPRALQPSQERL